MLDRALVLPHLIAERAAATPDRAVMKDVDGRVLTYAELDRQHRLWAAALRRLDVTPGENVMTMLPNSFEAYLVWLGLAWIRAIEVPANTGYLGTMLAYLLRDSGARVAVVAERFLPRLLEVAPDLEHLEVVVVPDATGPLPDATGVRIVDAATLLAGLGPDTGPGPDPWDICSMIYTSGTTGPSKGVLVPWAELYEFVRLMPDESLGEDEPYYTVYPAFHVSGKSGLYVAGRFGGHLVIRETFSLTEFWNDIRRFEVRLAGLVGPMAGLLLLAPPAPDDADNPLEKVFMGPLIPQLEEFKQRFGIPHVGTGFGMTEIGAPIGSEGFHLPNTRTCGKARTGPPHYEVRLVDEHDEPVGPGTVGELVVRAREPWVINAGYYNRPEQTAAAWRNGWFHTGDAFTYDDDGYFYFVDRLKDAIRRRGENISSFEVEALVNQHPKVAESAAVAVPAEVGEDEIKICVVPRPGEQLGPEELIEFLVPRMPRFMIPRYVEFIEGLPKTEATLRTRKVELRHEPLNGNTWDREAAGIELPR